MVTTDELAATAREAVRAGGDYLSESFRDPVTARYGRDDVKADADEEAERRVLDVIARDFPGHATHGEESGYEGRENDEYVWVVDPLDGTNNFASGFPSFATAVCACRNGDPVVSAIYEPLPDTLYVARRGEGATENGVTLSAGSDVSLEAGTVSLVVGLPAVRDDDLRAQARAIRDALEGRCKRVLESWSPCVDWGLLARGSIEGIVCFHPDVYEQRAGSLLAREAGVVSVGDGDVYVGAGDADDCEEIRETVPMSV